MKKSEDQQLIEKFKEGDEGAARKIFKMFWLQLTLFARELIKDEEEAKDIVQEIFLKLWQLRENFETLQNVKAFLYISTRNKCFDLFTQRKSQNENHQQIFYLEQNNAENENANDEITADLFDMLHNEIENLPKVPRTVFILTYFKNMSIQEIANKLGINAQTVRNQKARAIKALKEIFQDKELMLLLIYYLIL